jgi:hypothetical protein
VTALPRPIRRAVRAFGVEIRRIRSDASEPPPLVDDPLEALHLARGGAAIAFRCPLDLASDTRGFTFGPHGWHPWIAELQDQQRRERSAFAGSLLERYFGNFQPRTALEALPGFEVGGGRCGLGALPSELFWLTPWMVGTPEELRTSVRAWTTRGAQQHGLVDYTPDRDGSPYHGPVSERLGQVEVGRMRSAHAALCEGGYDRRFGDSLFYLVRRGRELRAVKFGSGYHRTAAAAALGHHAVPAQLREPLAVDVDDVDDWPQVRSGMWSREAALRYVDHLFDFDARAWARGHGLA